MRVSGWIAMISYTLAINLLLLFYTSFLVVGNLLLCIYVHSGVDTPGACTLYGYDPYPYPCMHYAGKALEWRIHCSRKPFCI